MDEKVKKTIDKPLDAVNRLSQGKSSINQIRVEYGLNPLKDRSADRLFITNEKRTAPEVSVQEQPKKTIKVLIDGKEIAKS